ncbi:MAG: hypothetical protein HOV68_05425 [Streptomycetaceae bacterium]|nr:hypothetical protein [Streptomycetaceae bacterium]
MSTRLTLVCLPPSPAEDVSDALADALDSVDDEEFDSYEVGGDRYSGHFRHLPFAKEANDPRLIRTHPVRPGRCTGGPLGLLNLSWQRQSATGVAADLFDSWTHGTSELPKARTLAELRAELGSGYAPIHAFRQQPRVLAVRDFATGPLWLPDMAALVALDRHAFIERARRRAVPGDSLLDLDGRWTTDPLWTQEDDDAETGSTAYTDHVNAYLDALDGDHIVVAVDCRR